MALPEIGHEFLVVSAPELRFTPSGDAVANFRVKASSRKEEPKGSGNWVDKDVLWATVTCWRDLAQHVVDSIVERDLVLVQGTLKTREYESNGVKQKAVEIDATAVGPSLKFRTTPHGAGAQQAQQPQQGGQWTNQPPAYGQPQAQPQYAQQPAPQPGYGQPPAPYQQPQQPPAANDPWGTPPQGMPPF